MAFPQVIPGRNSKEELTTAAAGEETSVPTDSTLQKPKTIQKVDLRDLRFHLVPVGQSTTINIFANESQRRFILSAS